MGPFLPGQEPGKRRKVGPKVPTAEDLDMQRGSTPPPCFLLSMDG